MSFIDGISGAVGLRPTAGGPDRSTTLGTGTTPGAPSAAQGLTRRFGSVFGTTFNASMATVFERGVKGEFDDPALALQEQAALQRLRVAQQAAESPQLRGADAAPEATGDDEVIGGGSAPAPAPSDIATYTTAPSGAAAPLAVAEQGEVYAVRVRQSEARLSNISSSLASEFPLAAKLRSASSGSWDPATFQPKSKEEAEAFAQRMVIDATEAAARLEIVTTQRDAAQFAAQTTGSADASALVVKLDAELSRQHAYADKLVRIVDRASGGTMREAGRQAMAGSTLRDDGDIPIDELAAALVASGADRATIERLVGATELAVEEEQTPGGSPRLRQISLTMTDHYIAKLQRIGKEMREDSVEDRQEWARQDEARAEAKAEAASIEQRAVARQQADARAVQRQAMRQAELEQWLRANASG